MKNFPLIISLIFCGSLGSQEILTQAQALYDSENYKAALSLLEKNLAGTTGDLRSRILVAMARSNVRIGDELKKAGMSQEILLAHYEKGESFGREATTISPSSAEAWYWKSSNMGRWGQTKGVLDSLMRAGDLKGDLDRALKFNPDYADAYYVLGIMYEALPGWPVSFGNKAWSVSLGRKALDLMEADLAAGRMREYAYGFPLELAKHLWARDWDVNKRNSEKANQRTEFQKTSLIPDKNFYYESQVTLAPLTDRQEARDLVQKTMNRLEATGMTRKSHLQDLEFAQKLLTDWK